MKNLALAGSGLPLALAASSLVAHPHFNKTVTFEGKPVLTLHFGQMFLSGALD